MTSQDLVLRSATLRHECVRLRKRALLARLVAMQTCLRSEDVGVGIAVDRILHEAS